VAYGSVHRADLVEHENLMKAALSHDLALVSALSERHIRKTLEIVLYDIGSRMPIFGDEDR
jgi:DNA-binding GntR family transcriptional regulator